MIRILAGAGEEVPSGVKATVLMAARALEGWSCSPVAASQRMMRRSLPALARRDHPG
jgi:hypothetical protein